MKSTIAFLRLSALTKLRDLKHTIVSHKSTKSTSVFDDIHRNNHWKSPLSASGPGSELAETEEVRALLPGLVAELGIRTLLDVPCGDFSWMKQWNSGTSSTSAATLSLALSKVTTTPMAILSANFRYWTL